ncbi:MAG: hypothetical protein A2161_20605 [Candidatus Schekmanbacteria bacterium RBG_13_48_7]|uniref:Uncharacterized protein n=1 Tax=Candidatus Schekmanbacteria bacterium RBG_13_48_7 TaxID=1817878 RepID=A0A1F7RPW8_9BACT|nr:MAG: hypothetical protein A2161_20605 [Candidatus Schekmanbacteria bacterium RBG_13_48_7]
MFLKIFLMGLLLLVTPQFLFAGTAYIPFWQHGFGVTYYNNIFNLDTKTIRTDVYLYDVITSTTYTMGDFILPGDSLITDTGFWGAWPGLGELAFGWGWVESTADPGKTMASGAIYGTVLGKTEGFPVTIEESGFSGTAYIPIWQHGYSVSYFSNILNTDSVPIDVEITLIDIVSSPSTYTKRQTIPAHDIWMFDTESGGWGLKTFNFGWGYMTSTGAPGTTYAWGAIHGIFSGQSVGLTVLIPKTGF